MMRPIVTDVARSVCLSVCVGHTRAPCKTPEPIEMPFGGRFVWTSWEVHIGASWRIRLMDLCGDGAPDATITAAVLDSYIVTISNATTDLGWLL